MWDNNVVDNDVSKQHPFIWGQTYYQIINNDSDPQSGDSWRTAISQSLLRLVDFFTNRVTNRYWLKRMDRAQIVRDATSDLIYVAAEPGVQYVFYKADGGEFYADLPTGRTWTIYRFNPRNGAFVQVRQSLAGGRTLIGTTAENTDWAYIAR